MKHVIAPILHWVKKRMNIFAIRWLTLEQKQEFWKIRQHEEWDNSMIKELRRVLRENRELRSRLYYDEIPCTTRK